MQKNFIDAELYWLQQVTATEFDLSVVHFRNEAFKPFVKNNAWQGFKGTRAFVLLCLDPQNVLHAVKCYPPSQESYLVQKKYDALAELKDTLPVSIPACVFSPYFLTVDFSDIQRRYHAVIMPVIPGRTLFSFLQQKALSNDTTGLKNLYISFLVFANTLLGKSEQFTHGDIHAYNIIIDDSEKWTLVDCDSIRVPGLSLEENLPGDNKANHHPAKNGQTTVYYYTDDFSLLILAINLYAFSIQPQLIQNWNERDASLIDRESLEQPLQSRILQELSQLNDPYLNKLIVLLQVSLSKKSERIADLSVHLGNRNIDLNSPKLELRVAKKSRTLRAASHSSGTIKLPRAAIPVPKSKQVSKSYLKKPIIIACIFLFAIAAVLWSGRTLHFQKRANRQVERIKPAATSSKITPADRTLIDTAVCIKNDSLSAVTNKQEPLTDPLEDKPVTGKVLVPQQSKMFRKYDDSLNTIF